MDLGLLCTSDECFFLLPHVEREVGVEPTTLANEAKADRM